MLCLKDYLKNFANFTGKPNLATDAFELNYDSCIIKRPEIDQNEIMS